MLCTELDQYPRLCTPSLVPNSMSPSKGSVRPSIGGADHLTVAQTVMVPSLNGPACGLFIPRAQD